MPSLFFVKDGEITMANADISLLFGVLGEGSLSGESGSLIQSQLGQIMKSLNENPLKVKIGLDTEKGGQKSWSSQLQTKLDALGNSEKFSVKVSKIEIGAGAVTDFKKQLNAVINTINLDKGTSITLTAEGIGEIKKKMQEAGDEATEAARKVAEFKVQMEALGGLKTSVHTALSSVSKSAGSEEERSRIAELTAQYEQWAIRIEAVRAGKNSVSGEYRAELEREGDAILENINLLIQEREAVAEAALQKQAAADEAARKKQEEAAAQNAANQAAKQTAAEEAEYRSQLDRVNTALIQAKKNLESWTAARNGKSSGSYSTIEREVQNLEDLKAELLNSNKAVDDFASKFGNANSNIRNASESIRAAGENTKTLAERTGSLANKFSSWLTISQIIMQVYRALKQMVTAVIEVDTAMTELRKVTNETEATYAKFIDTAIRRSKELGATVSDTITASADFARLGYSLDDASALADAAIVYKNVGDGITDITMASESIISTMKAFGIAAEDAMFIVDKFNEVGNNFAISSKGVGDALLRSASALAAGNNTLDESIALITAANSVVQDADVVGTTLKTVSMYLRAAKTEAEEAGESTEGMANSVSELRAELLALTGEKVDIQIDEDTFKSTTQIIRELANVWDDLSDISRANILEMIGGKRNANVVSSLIENFETAEKVITKAANATGSALAENEKYLESIRGAISQFQATFEELSITLIDGEMVEDIVDIGTALLNLLNIVAKVINVLGGLKVVLLTVASSFLIAKGGIIAFTVVEKAIAIFNALRTGIASVINIIPNAIVAWKTYAARIVSANTAIQASIPVIGLVIAAISAVVAAISLFSYSNTKAKKSIQELNDEYDTLKDKIDSVADSYRDLKSTSDDVIPRFVELAKGVDKFGKNVSLTDEEYAEFLELNNKIADMFPEINMGMDSSGNAMLALSYSADTLTNSLNALVEAQRNAANQQIAETMPSVLDNIIQTTDGYKEHIDELKEVRDEYHKVYEDFLNRNLPTDIGRYANLEAGKRAAEEFIAKAKELGIHGAVMVDDQHTTNNGYVFTVDWDYSPLENNSKFLLDYVDDQFALVTEKYDKLINNYQSMIKAKWAQLNSVVNGWMQTNFMFQDLDGTMQEIAEVMVSGLNFGDLGLTTKDDVQNYIDDYIIKPLFLSTSDVKEAFASITDWQEELKNGEITSEEFSNRITQAFDTMFASMSPDAIDEFKTHFVDGFNQIGISGDSFVAVLQSLITEWSRVEQTVKTETKFDRQYKEHQHLLAMEQESVEDYLNWLKSAYPAAYAAGQIELDEYRKYEEEAYNKTKDLFSDYLNDNEHSIFLLENADAEASEIVKIYSGMMTAIEAQIQTYKSMGLNENSDYIQELQKQWYGYRDNILSVHEDALNADIGDYEHDIFMLEQHGGSADEIAAIYRKMQEAVHATAEEYRALGLEENDDYIQELQRQWWEYEENIAQLRQDEFDDYLNDSKFSVEQLKADGASASEISRSYSAILKAINDEIEYYTSKGFDITDEIVQNLIDEARNLEDEVISSLNEIVSEAQSAVDDLQNVYTTLSDAADEYAEYGYITIDSLQSIIDLGVEYMAFLQDENGQLVINKENIQNVIAARTEQLAVESALNYVEQLRLALEAGNTAELERLLYATNNATNATWGLVYANLALLNLEDSQYTAALNNINNLRSLADNAIANIGSSMSGTTQSRSDALQAELDARKEALQEQKDALDDILDYTMELIEWEAEQQVEALEEQISDYEEIVELKKEMLEATKEEADYEDELADKIEEIAKIQERINTLSLDDSREAQAEKITLEEELADLQEELTDYQADHMLETHENTLDDMADAYSAEKEKEIAAVEETVSSTEKVYQLAIERINNDWNGLYQDLLAYNYEYGSTLQQDLVSAWNAASLAVQEYGSYVQAVSSITAAINAAENTTITPASGTTNLGSAGNYSAEANASKQKVLQVSSLVDRMEANSAAWWNASESERDKLEDANVQIAAQIEALLGEKLVPGADGVWYLGSVGSSRKLYDCYHDGGIVGGLSTLKKNETFAVLENGEMVLTDEQQASLFRLVDFATTLSDRFGKLIENVGYSQLFQRKGATTADELAAITEDKRVNIEFGDVYITGTNDETVEKHREVNRQFVNDVLKQLNIKR